jgi:hypothetical protein
MTRSIKSSNGYLALVGAAVMGYFCSQLQEHLLLAALSSKNKDKSNNKQIAKLKTVPQQQSKQVAEDLKL